MALKIVFSTSAAKQFAKIDLVWRERIRQRLVEYATDVASHSGSVKMLKGDKQMRLRVGDYRVIFTADGIVLSVTEIGHRREVYRR